MFHSLHRRNVTENLSRNLSLSFPNAEYSTSKAQTLVVIACKALSRFPTCPAKTGKLVTPEGLEAPQSFPRKKCSKKLQKIFCKWLSISLCFSFQRCSSTSSTGREATCTSTGASAFCTKYCWTAVYCWEKPLNCHCKTEKNFLSAEKVFFFRIPNSYAFAVNFWNVCSTWMQSIQQLSKKKENKYVKGKVLNFLHNMNEINTNDF